ncbi:hypothetical protein PFISCL1PPCAC_24021, partial [Pristionchus fissidentatus]
RADEYFIALSSECVSDATTFLHDLKLVSLPSNFRQTYLQLSDRRLEDCSLYIPLQGLDEDNLLRMEGASREFLAPSRTQPPKRSNSASTRNETESLMSTVMYESSSRMTPLYLFPRRCYERLARELIDSGSVFCADYDADKHIDPYDRLMLPLINDSIHTRGSLTSILSIESSLMEYGSCEWMAWFARRLRYHNYNLEVIDFYHRIVAEREYGASDEKLIQRLREALIVETPNSALSHAEKIKVDAFVNSTMDTLNGGDGLVQIKPPFKSDEAAERLASFIRSRRIPPV